MYTKTPTNTCLCCCFARVGRWEHTPTKCPIIWGWCWCGSSWSNSLNFNYQRIIRNWLASSQRLGIFSDNYINAEKNQKNRYIVLGCFHWFSDIRVFPKKHDWSLVFFSSEEKDDNESKTSDHRISTKVFHLIKYEIFFVNWQYILQLDRRDILRFVLWQNKAINVIFTLITCH